jgi:hypothetical protein
MSHTPGPWRVESTPICGNRIVHGDTDGHGYADDVAIGCRDSAALPNLQLAATAPELLEALTALRDFMWSEGYADQTAEMRQAEDVIAKATGDL